jgi:hypothetical protein
VVDQRVAAANKRANVEAPPLAMLVAAAMLAMVVGFAAALGVEVRRPRVADAREAERIARARVLAVIQPELVSPSGCAGRSTSRSRTRSTVRESYRMLYLSLSAPARR